MLSFAVIACAACLLGIVNAREIRLGGAIAFSGNYKSSGMHCQQGWTLWAKRLNERGGITLPNGEVITVKLPLDLRDDESSKTKSKELLGNMLDPSHADYANLDFVIGPFSSGITSGNSLVAAAAQKILFSHGASESLHNSGNGYIFSVLTPGGSYMSSGLELLKSQGAKSVVFAHEQKSFSESVCRGGNATAYSLGMNVAGYFAYPPGTQNFAEIIFDIKGKNPDVVVGCGHISDINYLIGQSVLMDVNPKAMLVTHASDSRVIANVAAKSHALLSPTQWQKDLAFADEDGFFGTATDFHKDYLAEWNMEPPYQAAYAAAMGYALQKAIEGAGTVETEAVRAALYSLNIESFYGPISFSPPNDPSGLVGTMPRRPMVTTQILFGDIGVVAPVNAANFEVKYPAPAWAEKDLLVYPCAEGEEDVVGSCVPCKPGTYRDFNLLQCKPCPTGTFTAVNGTGRCHLCEKGTFGASEGLTACEDCHVGRAAVEKGMAACPECRPGHFMNETGAAECRRCPEGIFTAATASTACIGCPFGKGTLGLGAIGEAECICMPGEYYQPGLGCKTCASGLECPGGNEAPSQGDGHYVETVDEATREYFVYQCFNPSACPAGELGTCAEPFSGRSCAVCGPDAANPEHACPGCRWYVPCLSTSAFLVMLYVVCRVTDNQRYGKVTAVSMLFGNLAVAVNTLQSVNIVMSFFPEVPPALQWLVAFTEIFMFRMEWALPGCDFGTSFGSRFVYSLVPPVAVVGGYIIVSLAAALMSRTGQIKALAFDSVFNASGMLLQTLYVVMCKSSLGYLMAQPHAAGPKTLALYPDVLMWEDTHMSMVWLGAISILLFVVGMYSVLVFAVAEAPHRWGDAGFRKRFRFCFARWRPNACYWGLLMLGRNFLVAVVPALITDSMTLRSAAFIVLIGSHALAEAWHQPWLTWINNMVEIGMSLLLILMSVGALSGSDEQGSDSDVSVVMFAFAMIWVLFFVAAAMTLIAQTPRFKASDKMKIDSLEDQLVSVASQLSLQEAPARAKRSAVLGSLSAYDISALTKSLKMLNDDMLEDGTAGTRRVRFSFLGAASPAPAAPETPVKNVDVVANESSVPSADEFGPAVSGQPIDV
eukprot:TRINITY_DN27656_c0_g1_i1.p1 TRINITY_DN27656_c0_g1~~TRINITY_DN27656_c0_g1_i1.p1  ORF type:complete len:1130 (+),score=216.13 TRINITY_DN27656_c0_g1_i1:65-3391(+)